MFRLLASLFGLASFVAIIVALAGLGIMRHLEPQLPDHQQLADYKPAVMTRVHDHKGNLVGEFARERRLFVPFSAIPDGVVNAFIAAEDKNFYHHNGIDYVGIGKALYRFGMAKVQGRDMQLQGASTITQQVTKNFLLTRDRKIQRKIKEAMLATRIERVLTKEQIMELYLNEIFFGERAYGIAAASLAYFKKPMDELSVEEAAYLASLPKGPNNYHPIEKAEAAKDRRDWVIGRMRENGFASQDEAKMAQDKPLVVSLGRGRPPLESTYFIEDIRREIVERFGEKILYGGGLSVRATLNQDLQPIAEQALRRGLMTYDRNHGWRGPIKTVGPTEGVEMALADVDVPVDLSTWQAALVKGVKPKEAELAFLDGKMGKITLEDLTWARRAANEDEGSMGPKIKSVDGVLAPGDVIYVEAKAEGETFDLRQIPVVNGALIAMEIKTGKVRAMQGGFSFGVSEFNRATQALRQPGSSFKPFVYAAALDSGYTPASIVMDAPVVLEQGAGERIWKPSNYGKKFYGPSTLRLGIERSRNLMTVRIAQEVGMAKIVEYAKRFGISENMDPVLSMALGAGETTLMQMVTAYSILANNGQRVNPTLTERIQDRDGVTVYRHDSRLCDICIGDTWTDIPRLTATKTAEQVINPQTAFQVVSMLRGVVLRGTATKLQKVGRPVAGKTGTTNEARDAWFIGFTPEMVVGAYIGFDNPKSLGKRATGGGLAAPVVSEFMKGAFENKPKRDFSPPPGIRMIAINRTTGTSSSGGKGSILEAFKDGEGPNTSTPQTKYTAEEIGGSTVQFNSGSGGLY